MLARNVRRTKLTKQVLTVGLTYAGDNLPGVEIENLGLCQPSVSNKNAAFPLYEYDTIIINPSSFTHFLFGKEGKHSRANLELHKLKQDKEAYDFDNLFDRLDRENEMAAAIAAGSNVVWCLSEPQQQNFYGYRTTHLGYVAPKVAAFVKRSDLLVKKGRKMGSVDHDSPFTKYFQSLSRSGWTLCLGDTAEGYTSIASTPEGYSLGGRLNIGSTSGWLVTPPTSEEAADQLIRDSIALEKADATREKYHGVFLSHTGDDKPFVRRLRDDLQAHGVERVWVDEAEIEIGDSLITKIEEGMKLCRFIAVVLSPRSIKAPWVKKELDVAMNREIGGGDVVVLPLLYEKCDLPEFLKGKLYADFTDPDTYDDVLAKLLRRLRIR